ncbi:uncharacterized protein L969DRAFT_43736 [Mixia osmundae IAM 14324]|uniref:Ribosome assembly protein 1 n=1 Tax=Mixia osmundae (strain CBS 9802 / IAM 14324 / JCM 22182 / KY 12970) TaxID=764103 RepID=G7E077_MIXOS|nr:uncharacterized protein L969DRAFT_43736 [Mixia osmundae IAM 14324]KEI42227.1 hypothetical protein L969DRAFT_43736 [Mixia osmundae IAM 14324]GAA96237.1 hypothetical protein E5Q_02901 [Mixia osmundae IAM 14324]
MSRYEATSTRSIALVAHVDHGKSSYADSLLASNGIISTRLAGSIRYLDSREDEQEKGITMESSAVSLKYKVMRKIAGQDAPVEESFLINLIDSPGHIDFSSEVAAALRVTDGALVLVDAVEGVCTQTITVLRQVWLERLRPILVINKMDRLITELKLAPIEAHHHLFQLVEQVNAVIGSLYADDRQGSDAQWRESREARLREKTERAQEVAMSGANEAPTTEDDGVDEAEPAGDDEEDTYFAPENGNVIFASAIDGWAFRIATFAHIHAVRLGIQETKLRKVLWGDFFLDPKSKRVLSRKHLGQRNLKPMFVQFVLENIWSIYDNVSLNPNVDKVGKIVSALGLKIRPMDLKSKDSRNLLVAIFSQWLPLASCTFRAVVEQIPGPSDAQSVRLPRVLHPELPVTSKKVEPKNDLERALYSADRSSPHTVVYVSKMFSVATASLPQYQRRQLTAEEMRDRGRQSRADGLQSSTGIVQADGGSDALSRKINEAEPEEPIPANAETLIGFARVFSGEISLGQELFAVMPKYTTRLPASEPTNAKHITTVRVDRLYMLMGRELVVVDKVPAGHVVGIGGLEGKVTRNATLCAHIDSTPNLSDGDVTNNALVNLTGRTLTSAPIVRVALEPCNPAEMPKLIEGLKLLNQADPAVETLLQETGEHVILTAGELHLERCLRDLRERFAKIAIQASPPIVPFRETAVKGSDMAPTKTKDAPRGTIETTVAEGLVKLVSRARPLPRAVADFLAANAPSIRLLYDATPDEQRSTDSDRPLDARPQLQPDVFWKRLDTLFEAAGKEWIGASDRVWSFGPRRIGANILFDETGGSGRSLRKRLPSEVNGSTKDDDAHLFDDAIETAFQLSTLRGPLCAEPITDMAFSLTSISFDETQASEVRSKLSQLTGSMISASQDAFKQGLLDWSPRLLLAVYSCDIQATAEVLGKVYGVLAKRRGRITLEEIKEGTSYFTIASLLPVVESFGFADEIRKRTSGAASPQLVFYGFEMLDIDPFWVPSTEEELEDLGEKSDRENVAKKYMDAVRARKGMFVERKISRTYLRIDKQPIIRRDMGAVDSTAPGPRKVNKRQRIFLAADVAKHARPGDCWVTRQGKVYNVTSFVEDHPGGDDLILGWAGKDVEQVMNDPVEHSHSDSAFEMMEEYQVGIIGTEETIVKADFEMVGDEYHPDETSVEQDYAKNQFLDLKEPLLMQVLQSNWSKSFYLQQVHQPRHLSEPARLFGPWYLEMLTRTQWFVVPIFWLPIAAYLFAQSFAQQQGTSLPEAALSNNLLTVAAGIRSDMVVGAMSAFAIGVFLWTILEYTLHRFLFHVDDALPDHPIFLTLHFLLHGIHHYLPMDRLRLVMPPTLFGALQWPFTRLAYRLLPTWFANAGIAGAFVSYVGYDMCHYALHHTKLPQYLKTMKTYHMYHHYKNPDLGFGVTSKIWDYAFGTRLDI